MALYRRTQMERCLEAEEEAARERDAPVCAHCRAETDENDIIETSAGLDCCSVLCATALYYNHPEDCRRPECGEHAPLTLPAVLCCYCDEPTGGPLAHESCRAKVMRAFALQDGARLGATA